jgi:hypothetical protein
MGESEYRSDLERMYPLDGVGTRFDHYNELREVFAEGIECLISAEKQYPSDANKAKLIELRAAEKMIVKRLEVLSGYERKTVYNAVLPILLREIDRERAKMKMLKEKEPHETQTTQDPNQASPAEDQEGTTDIT